MRRAYLTIDMETSHYTAETVCFSSGLAVFAGVANILNRLESCSLADLEVLDSFSHFDDDTCTFVTSTLGTKSRPDDCQYRYSVDGKMIELALEVNPSPPS
jgi:nicotinic acid phosphoribosyltransferase